MAAKSDPHLDLLGDPWQEPKDPRGRKRHRRLPQIAERIAVLRAGGSTEEEVAEVICLSVPTLRKYYFRELNEATNLARSALRGKLWDAAMKGNVAAIKALETIFDKGEPAVPIAPREAAEKPLGKKAEAEAKAKDAPGGSWGGLLQ